VRRYGRSLGLLGLLALLATAPFAPAADAAAPKFEDTIAQRVQACTACHGKEGRAASDGYYPRIAGKPAGYLYNQLIDFRDGRRRYALMTALIDPLSDAYLREIAGYFASLDLPYPPPQPATTTAAVLERGRTLVLHGDAARDLPACVACHGERLTGVAPAIPGLLGLPRDYLNGQFGAWRNGARRAHAPDCMAEVAKRLAPEDIGAVSQWLGAQPVPQPAVPASSLPAALPLDCGGVPQSSTATR
jgi:cytochrome c553